MPKGNVDYWTALVTGDAEPVKLDARCIRLAPLWINEQNLRELTLGDIIVNSCLAQGMTLFR